ncbi:hypothetical protein KY285_011764 [Solanum tuberosum]|nr:hypothetical protein KY285_011764 [Solanum tuberosum]
MAREPPGGILRPPDLSQQGRLEQTNKTHEDSPSNSSYSSTNSRNNEAMLVAISEKELDGIQKVISPDRDMVIHGNLFSGNDSTNQGLQHTEKSSYSILPIARTEEAISEKIAGSSSEMRHQFRPTSQQFHGELSTGDYSPGEGVHLTAISSEMDGLIAGGENSGDGAVEKSKADSGADKRTNSTDEEDHPTNLSMNLAHKHIQKEIPSSFISANTNHQLELEEFLQEPEAEQQWAYNHADPTSQKQNQHTIEEQIMKMQSKQVDEGRMQDQNDQHDSTGHTILNVIDVENEPHFSFGVKPMDTTPTNEGQHKSGKDVNSNNGLSYVQLQDHHAENTKSQSKDQSADDSQTSKSSKPNSSRIVSLSSSEDQVHGNVKVQKAVILNDQVQGREENGSQQQVDRDQNSGKNRSQTQLITNRGNSGPNDYQKAFPKISSNFDKHTLPNQEGQQIKHPTQIKSINHTNETQTITRDQTIEPAPYTVVQTLAARLRQIHATQAISIELVPPKHTTKQGQPAVIYDMDDYMNKLAVDCKYTLIGKFSTTMPKVELIRKSFIMQTQLNGGVNIAHYNARHVFIDLENELDYNTVWTQQRMTIEGKLMRIQTWTPNFRPEEETPIAPIWVLLPGLPWHCFKKEFITPLLESVGKVLYLDTASIKRTRASMAKVKVQVDLTKTRPRHVWIGLDDDDLTIGRWQSIEYENIPPYCAYCRHQGHTIDECNFKTRDEEFKRRKELETEKKSMSKNEQEQQGKESRQNKTQTQEEQQQQNKKEETKHQQPEQQKEDEWQVQRRKHNKSQEERIQRTMWRPTSSQNRLTKEQPKDTAHQTGTSSNSNHNSFTNLNMQEKQNADMQEPNSEAETPTQGVQNRPKADHNQKTQAMQTRNKTNIKSTGIDSMLPIPIHPNNLHLDGNDEADGGMDGGCQEIHTNMQEGVSKGGILPHVLHEGTHIDHNSDLRTPATTKGQQHSPRLQQVQQQGQTGEKNQTTTKNDRDKQQAEVRTAGTQNKGSMAKDMGAKASTSKHVNTPKSKNKPSKKRREAEKKKQKQQQDRDQQGEQQMNEEVCKKFIMVDEHLGMDITPLQTQYMIPPPNIPPDKRAEQCRLNKGPIFDEYAVNISEDELNVDNQSLKDPDEDDETSELLIRAFSPRPEKGLGDEIQQVTNEQGLSPRGIHHDRFQFRTQDINTVTAGRPNTRLFTSKSSQ